VIERQVSELHTATNAGIRVDHYQVVPLVVAKASSMSSSARSTSCSVMIRGGAMRNTPPMSASLTMFIERPSSMHRSEIALGVSALPHRYRQTGGDSRSQMMRRPSRILADDLHAEQQTSPADLADALVSRLETQQPILDPFADGSGAQVQLVPLDNVEHLEGDRGAERVRDMGRIEQITPFVSHAFNLGGGHDGRDRESGAQSLRESKDVGDDAVALESKHV
jgi:hypothetical protein